MRGKYQIIEGDCRDVLKMTNLLFDVCITDPPYDIGFMGRDWDRSGVAFDVQTWRVVYDRLKPGAHLLAFGGTRTYHRLVCAIEDAGFDVRDAIMWLYGSGFPKSLDVGKAVDKAAGVERPVLGYVDPRGTYDGALRESAAINDRWREAEGRGDVRDLSRKAVTVPVTEDGKRWDGWGTALKPAYELIVVARKPFVGTVAQNVLSHGVGALNIDACRVHSGDAQGGSYMVKRLKPGADLNRTGGSWRPEDGGVEYHGTLKAGRWPANVIHDGSEGVLEAFAAYGTRGGGDRRGDCSGRRPGGFGDVGAVRGGAAPNAPVYDDMGTAARFFYCAKANKADRAGSKHPTIKPIALMRYLCRLATPHGGTVLDPFAGSGSTLQAAVEEGFCGVGIEREPEFVADIRNRMTMVKGIQDG